MPDPALNLFFCGAAPALNRHAVDADAATGEAEKLNAELGAGVELAEKLNASGFDPKGAETVEKAVTSESKLNAVDFDASEAAGLKDKLNADDELGFVTAEELNPNGVETNGAAS